MKHNFVPSLVTTTTRETANGSRKLPVGKKMNLEFPNFDAAWSMSEELNKNAKKMHTGKTYSASLCMGDKYGIICYEPELTEDLRYCNC